MPGPKFTIAALLAVTAVAALTVFCATYPSRMRARTIAIYDTQKEVVDEAIAELVVRLKMEGNIVVNDSTRLGGSGEWRKYAAITTTDTEGKQSVCYVEIMGFVTHDDNDKPTWMGILPMRISHRGRPLNDRLIDILTSKLNDHNWIYIVDSNCEGGHSKYESKGYLATQ